MLRLLILLSLWISASTPLWAECLLGKLNGISPVFDESGVYLPATINGKAALFRLDTGIVHSFLYQDTARALGLTISEWGGQIIEAASTGLVYQDTEQWRTAMADWHIGKWRGRNMFLPVSAQIDHAKPGGLPVVGVLGEDLLSHYEVDIDVKAGLFALYRPEGCESANLAYWSKDYNVVDMIGFDPRDPRVEVAGKLDDAPIVMRMASGRGFTAVSSTAAGSRGVSSDNPDTKPLGSVTGFGGKTVDGWLGTFSSFALDEESISQAKIAFIKFPPRSEVDIEHGSRLAKVEGADAQMLLGFDFLRAHHVLISHSQHKVYFSYTGDAPFAAPEPEQPTADPIRP